ncbi:MAG: 4-(cytidine 5'-diphospho)-2-C-methyl-D-erythritol kinase [Peptoniphilus grossensis]|uniref:4-(cytidine 5'-diphospho)-2-C-methyl-D-erythritol kinase n=1 Tax=Peptoniphilus grossensis TaxID=1465756 RepID=UPI0029076F6A|nr:4-(cytidine 5'-diphospho)-2-C-methyl-D-erythritol kinase [Peptoniphilus grossensis]MDU7151715.1 4-(cytidine 5'-diphospho)-2-C-methyl-D-erythritol kinase [Peptoniphilus grossensis]
MIKKNAHAKLNLSLDVTGKRENGYHDIKTLMVMTDLCDEMIFSKSERLEIIPEFSFDLKSNLIYKAYELLKEKVGYDLPFKVEIKKKIPIAAGLAGGTSNGAACLYALNDLYKINIPRAELIEMAGGLGADFTYMMTGGSKIAKGIGDILEEVDPIELDHVLIINPGYGVSTKEVYQKIKIDKERIDFSKILEGLYELDIEKLNFYLRNKMEDIVFSLHPDLLDIKNKLRAFNSAPLMSGSGATIFGIFADEKSLEEAYDYFKKIYKYTYKVRVGEGFGSF